jgi:monoterpene epsilon-lactone hydrolase
MVSSEALKLN